MLRVILSCLTWLHVSIIENVVVCHNARMLLGYQYMRFISFSNVNELVTGFSVYE